MCQSNAKIILVFNVQYNLYFYFWRLEKFEKKPVHGAPASAKPRYWLTYLHLSLVTASSNAQGTRG